MRGEDSIVYIQGAANLGSPPHARGRRAGFLHRSCRPRITPACAGKTCPPRGFRRRRSDHPRMRGEDVYFGLEVVDCRGSPPHARGRRRPFVLRDKNRRITPACAGKTIRSTVSTGSLTDHPRMRGEDFRWRRCLSGLRGSPPHARGRRRNLVSMFVWRGITPACAGKTSPHKAQQFWNPDHPRMRGEDGGPNFL